MKIAIRMKSPEFHIGILSVKSYILTSVDFISINFQVDEEGEKS